MLHGVVNKPFRLCNVFFVAQKFSGKRKRKPRRRRIIYIRARFFVYIIINPL